MKKILFCCYGGGHVQLLLPIIKKLSLNKQYNIKVFALTLAGDVLKNNQIDCFSYKNLAFDDPQIIKKLGHQLSTTILSNKIDPEETIAYLGANMQEIINLYGQQKAEELYKTNGRACFYPLNLMTKLLQEINPDLVVATNSPRSEKAIVQAATNLNISTLCLIDGFAMYESEWIASPAFCQHVGVISSSVKNNLIKQGKAEKYIHIVGNPAFDPFYKISFSDEIECMKKKILIGEHQKVIMYAPSPEGNYHIYTGQPTDSLLPEKILHNFISLIRKRKDLFLIIRPHPSQKFKLSSLPDNTFYDDGNNLKTMLSLSDLVVTLGSTVGIQAQLLGKPLICCNQSIYANDISYEDFGFVKRIYSMDNIEHIIDQEIRRAIQTPKPINEKRISATENACKLIEYILS